MSKVHHPAHVLFLAALCGVMEDGGITLGLTEGIFRPWMQGSAVGLSLITVVLSNLVSNVPAVPRLESVVPQQLDPAVHLEIVALRPSAGAAGPGMVL